MGYFYIIYKYAYFIELDGIGPVDNRPSTKKVPQSTFLSTVILNVDYIYLFFLAFFAIFLDLVRRTESVRQRNHWLVTKRVFVDPLCGQTNNSFVALTQCNKQ